MFDLNTMEAMQKEAIRKSRQEGKILYRAVKNGDENVFKCPASEIKVKGYKFIQDFFVDNSGFGSDGEPALTATAFLRQVKEGFYYGIISQGQFQVYIGEFKKIKISRNKKYYASRGIISSKLVKNHTRLTVYVNGDKILRLHDTDIIKWQGDKIILNSGGWDTVTTRSRFNEFLPDYIHVYRDKKITYISYNNEKIKFVDGVELQDLKA